MKTYEILFGLLTVLFRVDRYIAQDHAYNRFVILSVKDEHGTEVPETSGQYSIDGLENYIEAVLPSILSDMYVCVYHLDSSRGYGVQKCKEHDNYDAIACGIAFDCGWYMDEVEVIVQSTDPDEPKSEIGEALKDQGIESLEDVDPIPYDNGTTALHMSDDEYWNGEIWFLQRARFAL